MGMHKFDELDMRILSELTKDASISVPRLSKKLNVNASVLYSRIKRLYKAQPSQEIHSHRQREHAWHKRQGHRRASTVTPN